MINTLGILWMSPGNSYFKKDKINKIITHYAQRFDTIHILSPATLAKHTYSAIGYEDTKARSKARRNTNRLLNHAARTIQENKLKNVKIIDWKTDIAETTHYKQAKKYITQLYKNNAEFKKDAQETTCKVLESKTKKEVSQTQINEAVNYLLAELAYVWAVSQTHKSTHYIYHHSWPILDKLIDGTYTGFKSNDIKFTLNEL